MKLTLLTGGLLASALTVAMTPEAQAADVRIGVQLGNGRYGGGRYGDGRYDSRETWRHGYNRGVHEGYREGERDARRNERFAYRDEGRYRDSDRGYKRWMGPRFEYANGYRRGFEEGYERGYRRYARYDGYDRDGWRDRDRDGWRDRRDRDDWRDNDRRDRW